MSREQARRFEWVAPESSALKESEMKLLVNKFTTGLVGQKVAKRRREGLSVDMDELWTESKKTIIEGLQRSKHPVEDFGEPDY